MSNDSTASNNPFNRWWIASALFVLAVIVAVVLVLIFGRGNQDDATGPGPQPSTTSDAAQPVPSGSAPGANGCDVNTTNQDIPTAGPQARWVAERYFFYPTSTEYGPVGSNSLWGCFSPTPTGALFAAANAVAGVAREDFADVVKANAVNNGGGEQFITLTQGRNREQSPGRVAQLAGFTFMAVDANRATVQIVLAQSDVRAASTVALVWDSTRSTWLVDYATSSMTPTQYSGAAFTPWAANG